MMKHYFKYLAVVFALIAIVQSACTPMDDYKKFYTDKEIQYPGQIDSVVVFSGRERVLVTGLFISDPKVSMCKIFWNTSQDSLEIPIQRLHEVDTLKQEIKLSEKLYNFIIYTYDKMGNRSVPVYAIGDSYGKSYEQSIVNRLANGSSFVDGTKLTMNWYDIEKTLGPISTEVTYTSVAGITKKAYVAPNESKLEILDYKTDTKLSYRTLYIPDTLCIDTFYTTSVENVIPVVKLNKKDWEIVDFSSQEETGEQGGKYGWAWQIIDDNFSTYWHSCHTCNPRPPFPHWISFDMKKVEEFTSFELTPRQDGGDPFREFEIRVSDDGTNWRTIGSYTLANNRTTQKFQLSTPCKTRFVELYMKNDYSGQPYNYLAELTLLREK